MPKKNQPYGFTTVSMVASVVVVAVIALAGIYVWKHADKKAGVKSTASSTQDSSKQQDKQTTKQTDPTENGKYLVISEWGVRVVIPTQLKNKVTYKTSQAQDPDTGLPLEGADIFVASDSFTSNSCAVSSTTLGPSVATAITYLRSNSSQPFNSNRYKGTLKANVLQDNTYSYHLNYVMPDCLGESSNEHLIKELQGALAQLQKVE